MVRSRPGSSTACPEPAEGTLDFPKKGRPSVGVTRQYCGQLGKQDNCQVAVFLSIANHASSLPIAYRLYLPEDWAADPDRRSKAGVPDDVAFRTKPEIALGQVRAALAAGIPLGTVLMDAGYGADTKLRTAITELGLTYAASIQPHTSVWRLGEGPLPPKPRSGRGRLEQFLLTPVHILRLGSSWRILLG